MCIRDSLKIVQPADAGIVKEILVREGETVRPGQVLMRMDTLISEADTKAIDAEYQRKRLTLRRIDAELAGEAFAAEAGDPPTLAGEVAAQYRACLLYTSLVHCGQERLGNAFLHPKLFCRQRVQDRTVRICRWHRPGGCRGQQSCFLLWNIRFGYPHGLLEQYQSPLWVGWK